MTGVEIAMIAVAITLVGIIYRAGSKLGTLETKIEGLVGIPGRVGVLETKIDGLVGMPGRAAVLETEMRNLKDRVTSHSDQFTPPLRPHFSGR